VPRDTTSHDVRDNETLFDGETDAPAAEPSGADRTDAVSKPSRDASRRETSTAAREKASPRMTAGDELEVRLARMHFWKGAYTRRGVNLQRHFYPEPLMVTDLDLLAIDITSQLSLTKTIGEAKSGTGRSAPKPLDRAIWIAGLKQLVGATSGVLVTATKSSPQVRDTARSLGVTCFTVDDLQRWENTHLPAALVDVGSQGPSAFASDYQARRMTKGEPSLERMYWFLKSEVWFLDSWPAIKRLLGGLGELRGFWIPDIDDGQASALRWMYAEAISILTLHLVGLVGVYQTSDLREWPAQVNDRLAEGAIPARNQRALADAFDKYLAHVLGELKAPSTVQVETMGAFHPTPPEWAEALIELLTRLESFDGLRELPRQTDLVIAERLVRRRHESTYALAALTSHDLEEFARMRRQIAAFIRGCVGLPDAVDKAISA
jgi:hypothetical protein